MELSNRWETDGLTYTTTMLRNETSYIILTPPMRLLDQNTSTIIGGAIIQMEIYRWQNTSGIINYTFTTSDDITFNTVIHPTHPKQGEKINFFTNSNAKLYKITWNFPELDWINASEVMEINNLEPGTYTVYVTGVDAFNQTHNAHTSFTVLPSSLNPQSFDLDFFSISYPEIVSQGEKITLSTTIDYSMPLPTLIKCTLFDPVNNVECKSLIYNVSDSGSKSFNYQFITNEEGIKSLVLRLYYDIGAGWIEVSEAKTNLSINIKKAQTSTSIPGFNLISIISGLLLIVFLYRTQMNN